MDTTDSGRAPDWRPWAACAFLLSFRARWAFSAGWASDDGCYLLQLGDLLGFALPPGSCPTGSFYAPGTSLSWLPSGLLGLAASAGLGEEPLEWIVPLAALQSFGFWALAMALASRLARPFAGPRPGLWGLLVTLNAPALYYATHRPLMSHTLELALAFGLVLAVRADRVRAAILVGAGLVLTRYNDLPALLIVGGHLLDRRRSGTRDQGSDGRTHWMAAAAATALAAMVLWIIYGRGYGQLSLGGLLRDMSLRSLGRVLFGMDYGLVWTAPWWLAACALGLARWGGLSWAARGALVWMLSQLAICVSWGYPGGDFGYRYLTGSYAGALLVWLELLAAAPRVLPALRWLTLAGAAWLTLLTTVYKTAPGTGLLSGPANEYNSDILLDSLRAMADPVVARIAALQQLPPVTLALSWFHADDPALGSLAVSGPGLLLLAMAVALALSVLGIRAARALRR